MKKVFAGLGILTAVAIGAGLVISSRVVKR